MITGPSSAASTKSSSGYILAKCYQSLRWMGRLPLETPLWASDRLRGYSYGQPCKLGHDKDFQKGDSWSGKEKVPYPELLDQYKLSWGNTYSTNTYITSIDGIKRP
ncbi:hypothetical protein NDU88_005425 [Pleurodeles waltl]|uniref:Uncharacterized protein n=1 Tax=Pleurodeles waltl TaxID=8319 RepID=A0AAV7MXG7_PLEWA|nr:hypothetical protein NDU88_005425 [Pleurodeles waltl]